MSTSSTSSASRQHSPSYSPSHRTALVLTGTGVHGAYHAGVLKALHEAGVKIDIVAGHGIGAAAAALAAIDGAGRLWENDGLWRSETGGRLYRWRPPLRIAAWITLALLLVLSIPLLVLALGMVIVPIGFLLEMFGASAGGTLTSAYFGWLQASFAGGAVSTLVPRLVLIVLAALVVTMFVGAISAERRRSTRRRVEGAWWWRLLGAPLDAEPGRGAVTGAMWDLIRGAAPLTRPSAVVLSRRYAEVLAENLGQPGFRELVLAATDLDARRDIVGSLLREPFRQPFVSSRRDRDHRGEILDLAGVGRDHVVDLISAALTPPLVCEPHLLTHAAEGFWRGETHRVCDRPGLVLRLLEEVAAAGATQVIVVSGAATVDAPHRLRPPRADLRGRIGEFQAAAEAAALRDAFEMARLRFESLFIIAPAHNAIGPFDHGGTYDAASDRTQTLPELMERAYEDAYRQFVEPVIGASGDQLAAVP